MFIHETFRLLLVVSQWPRTKNEVEYVCLALCIQSCSSSTIAICFAVCEHHVGHFCCCVDYWYMSNAANNLTALEDNKMYLIQNEGIAYAQECYYGHIDS